jgi:hypothetical protein
MSTHAIVWFQDEDILGLNDSVATAEPNTGERRWPRLKIDLRIRVTYTVGLEIETVDGQGHDICEGGMGTYIPAELNHGDNVVVELVLRYGQPRISFSAKVNNRNGFRYGLEFIGIEDVQRAKLVSSITGAQL